jgi:DNA-directed RNA polymerases I and III subunit RPAC1
MPPQSFHKQRLVGIQAERVTHVSDTEFPGHYPHEDFSWNLSKFKKVRLKFMSNFFFFLVIE